MKIDFYKKQDINNINLLGLCLHEDFKFDLDIYSNCLVLKEEDKLVGFITYSIIYERAEIIDIIVDKSYRNKGYGLKLISKVIEIASLKGCNNVTLEVNMLNEPAVNLYKKCGFKIETIRKSYYKDTDGYLMKKDLR